MRLKGRQGRFVTGSIGGWVALRISIVAGGTPTIAPILIGGAMIAGALLLPWPVASPLPSFQPARPWVAATVPGATPVPHADPIDIFSRERAAQAAMSARLLMLAAHDLLPTATQSMLRYAVYAPASDLAPYHAALPAAPRADSRWGGSLFLFVRPGSRSAALAAGGALGGSQAGGRVTYRLNRDGPTRWAAAARLYAPLESKGAEAAVGIDWHPLPRVPLRVSVERRVGLDRAGRDAWSAYAAGGFYRALPGKLLIDGYGQSGIVGLHARDLFVDGALRIGRQARLGTATLTMGAGLWGAAQPGVSRLDSGPRLAITVPVEKHAVSLAAEGRLRIAGQARPGSGAVLTLGVDF